MGLPKSETLHTVDDYLALERESEERHEYLDGLIYFMAGESAEHADICMNLSRIVSSQLLGTPCRAWSKDTKVRSGPILKSRYSTIRRPPFQRTHGPPTEGGASHHAYYKHGPPTEGRSVPPQVL